MHGFLWVMMFLSSILAAAGLIAGLMLSSDPQQQSAIGTLAGAGVVIVYCLARAWDELRRN